MSKLFDGYYLYAMVGGIILGAMAMVPFSRPPAGYAPRGGLPEHCEVRGGFAGPVDDEAGTMRYHLVCSPRDEWDTPYIIIVDESTFRNFQFGSDWQH